MAFNADKVRMDRTAVATMDPALAYETLARAVCDGFIYTINKALVYIAGVTAKTISKLRQLA
jgi:hypothetical protein